MRKPIAHIIIASLFATLAWAGSAASETLDITRISSPELTEIQRIPNGEYLYVSDLGELRYPLKASRAPNHRLHFKHKGKIYEIPRADVTVAGERLVVDACQTVPVTLKADSRSASVKGAGEACK